MEILIKKKKSNIKFYFFLILLIFIFLELLSYFTCKFFLTKVAAVFDKNMITQSYNKYLNIRDSEFGWDSPNQDKYGARIDHSNFKNSQPCIDVYGDSFTYGHPNEVYAWPSQLSSLVKCRVRNFGVGGYGSDQAFIKFLSKNNHSNIVFLNHLSENIIRNINQFRNFIYSRTEYAFKPRYIIHKNKLKLVPIPNIKEKNINDFLEYPNKYLYNEYFLPDGESGIQHLKFPYILNVVKSLNHWHLKSKILLSPSRLVDFYSPDHKSQGLKITYEILYSFYTKAKSQGLEPVLTIFPTCGDLKYYKKYNKYPYENLIKILKKKELRHIDFGPIFINFKDNDFEELYIRCSGHFNIQGEKLVSETIYSYIVENNLISK